MKGMKIRLRSLNFLSITECRIVKKLNNHGKAVICGIIDKKDEQQVIRMAVANSLEQIIVNEEEQKVLFSGIIESAKVDVKGDLRIATIHLTGATKLLDQKERIRTFQNRSMTYEHLLKTVLSSYKMASHYPGVNTGKPIGDMIVQYKETDWEFIKRLASHFHTNVYPDFLTQDVSFYFGLPAGSKKYKEPEVTEYCIENNTGEYRRKESNGIDNLISEDANIYKFKCRANYQLGDKVIFLNKELYVASVEIVLEHSELIYHYKLATKNGLQGIKIYNKKIIGASLDGKVIDIRQDKVKVHVFTDQSQDVGSAKWFPYSTVFSSPDGTGWYCMPEKNDRVRLYFPTEREEEGYIISSVHESGQNPGNTRSNPDNKSLSTKYGKQVELTPTTITMTNNKGMMVKIDDDAGISILSDKDICLQSDGTLSIISANETMSMKALESIELIQGNTKMTLKDDVTIEGARVNIQ